MKETGFDHAGVFTYSREEGTPAYDFPDQIDDQVKEDRYDILMREQLAVNEARNQAMIGKTVEVLCEDYDVVSEAFYGRSAADAPDVDGKIYFHSKKRIRPGTFVPVKITEVLDYDLVGEVQ